MLAVETQGQGFEVTIRWIWVTFAVSLLIHLLLAIFLVKSRIGPFAEDPEMIPVEIVFEPIKLLPTVDLPLAPSRDAPEDARFASDKNIKVDEETGGQSKSVESLTTKRQSPTVKSVPKPKSFSISQADLLDEGFERETLSADQRGMPSEAFLDKLKRGDALKVNARLFDYGQYINRMREKLSQRWNGRSAVSAEMFNQRVVEVSIAVVLDRNGEIVELRNMATSRFKKYDDEALRTLRESGPFPNPPTSLVQEDGLVYMTWNFTMVMDGWGPTKNVQ